MKRKSAVTGAPIFGSMPGKVIQSMKKAKKNNPLFLLDEIDKMGMDFRGDPVIGTAGGAGSQNRTARSSWTIIWKSTTTFPT